MNNKDTFDEVNHPARYAKDSVECIDAMRYLFGNKAVVNFCLCNIFKYLWRRNDKGGQQDVDKAIWYFDEMKRIILAHPYSVYLEINDSRKAVDDEYATGHKSGDTSDVLPDA